jgi:hypothetical protein
LARQPEAECQSAQEHGSPVRPAPAWAIELWRRIRRFFVLKVVGVTAVTWLFFIAYFHLLRHPVHPVTVMPLTLLDRAIPFQPQALVAYVSLWFYVGLAPGLLLTLRELIAYGLWVGSLCLAGLALFYVWPTAVPRLAADLAVNPAFAMLQGVDAAGNACPSMHVAAAIFSACWVDEILRGMRAPRLLRALNALWFCAIAYSTLAIKQHVLWDVLAGALLGLVFAAGSLRQYRRARATDIILPHRGSAPEQVPRGLGVSSVANPRRSAPGHSITDT